MASARDLQVVGWRLTSLFLTAVDRFRERGDVEYAVFKLGRSV